MGGRSLDPQLGASVSTPEFYGRGRAGAAALGSGNGFTGAVGTRGRRPGWRVPRSRPRGGCRAGPASSHRRHRHARTGWERLRAAGHRPGRGPEQRRGVAVSPPGVVPGTVSIPLPSGAGREAGRGWRRASGHPGMCGADLRGGTGGPGIPGGGVPVSPEGVPVTQQGPRRALQGYPCPRGWSWFPGGGNPVSSGGGLGVPERVPVFWGGPGVPGRVPVSVPSLFEEGPRVPGGGPSVPGGGPGVPEGCRCPRGWSRCPGGGGSRCPREMPLTHRWWRCRCW